MASLTVANRSNRLVLDAGAIIALSRGDIRARAFLALALEEGKHVLMPTPVLAQVHRGGRDHAKVDRVIRSVDVFVPTSASIARDAGELLGRAGRWDAVDAIVAAEALVGAPAAILTSDAGDLTALVEAGGGSDLVAILAV